MYVTIRVSRTELEEPVPAGMRMMRSKRGSAFWLRRAKHSEAGVSGHLVGAIRIFKRPDCNGTVIQIFKGLSLNVTRWASQAYSGKGGTQVAL